MTETFDPIGNQTLAAIGNACFGAAARRTANLVTRVYNTHLASAGLEVTQFAILAHIAVGTAQSSSELATMVGVERSTLARNLDRLIAADLVVAKRNDGRRVIHSLSETGRERLALALPLWRGAQEALQMALPADADAAIHAQMRLLRKAAHLALA